MDLLSIGDNVVMWLWLFGSLTAGLWLFPGPPESHAPASHGAWRRFSCGRYAMEDVITTGLFVGGGAIWSSIAGLPVMNLPLGGVVVMMGCAVLFAAFNTGRHNACSFRYCLWLGMILASGSVGLLHLGIHMLHEP